MTAPYVSIGLPVYDGERFLVQAIETILTQDFDDFELVISDNGSTDDTEEICRDLAASDRRIRYERHSRNRGAAWNYCRVLHQAHPGATYFKWIAADDEHAPSYLSTTLALLDDDPSAALAHTASADIDEDGFVLRHRPQPIGRLASADPAERLRDLVTMNHECFGAFGLIRHDVARATRGLGAYSDADNVLLVEIALRGRYLHDPETLFFRRQHPDRSTTAFPLARSRMSWFDADQREVLPFPIWRIGWEFTRSVHDAPLTTEDRRRCYRALSVFLRENWKGLAKNAMRSGAEAPGVWSRRLRDRPPLAVPAAEERPAPARRTAPVPPTAVVELDRLPRRAVLEGPPLRGPAADPNADATGTGG